MQPPLLFVIAATIAFTSAVPQFGYEEVHGYEKDPVQHQYDVMDQYERIREDIVQPFPLSATQHDKDAQQPAVVPHAEDKEKPVHPVVAEIDAKDKPVITQSSKPQGEAKANYDYEPEFDERKDTYGVDKDQADLEFNIKDTISNMAFKKLSPVYQQLDKMAKWDGDEKVDDEEEKDDEDKGDYDGNERSYGGRSSGSGSSGYGDHDSQRGGNAYGGRSDRDNEGYGGRSNDYNYGSYGGHASNKKENRNEGYDNSEDYGAQFEKDMRGAKTYA